MQVLCVLFSEMFCVKGLCLLYFHHVKEMFKSSLHLLLCVCVCVCVCGEMTFKSQRPKFILLIKSFIFGVKWMTKIKVGPLIFVM